MKGIQSFTGFANFYRKFIPNFSNIVTPLNLLTQKSKPWKWTSLQQTAFDELKHIFSSAPVLQIPDVTHPFSIMTNASLLAARAILLQSDTNQTYILVPTSLRPSSLLNRTMTSMTGNYLW